MGGGPDLAADVGKPAADPAWGARPGGVGGRFAGAAQVGGVFPGDEQLGVGGHDQADPPVGLCGGADFGGGQAEGALEEPEGVLFVETGQVAAPELVQ